MRSLKKVGATLAGLTLSGVSLAGTPSGTITFIASDVGPALSVPTLGVVTAVMLAGVLLVLALHTLHKNRHTLASFVLVGSCIGASLIVASMDVLHAVPQPQSDVTADDLGQPMSFECDYYPNLTETIFTNATGQPIEVESIDYGSFGCEAEEPVGVYPACVSATPPSTTATVLAAGESCALAVWSTD